MCTIRLATPGDAAGILAVYAPYVRDTAISFETIAPSVAEFAARIVEIGKTYPYLAAVSQGEIIGYAYASRHRERDAYRYDVELSIYMKSDYHGKGIAHQLYNCLFDILAEQGFFNAYAVVTVPNGQSVRFHEKEGFAPIGLYPRTGWKFGQWHDVAWLGKSLRVGEPGTIRGIGELPWEWVERVIYEKSDSL